MLLFTGAVIVGLSLLVWSADRFVDGAAATARHFNVPPLLIGMVIVGFGTSAPEMVVSALASWQGNPGIALGNAYGSNIANIGLVLGFTALLTPIQVHSQVLRRELPILLTVTLLAAMLLHDLTISRLDGWALLALLALFSCLMIWSIRTGLQKTDDAWGEEVVTELQEHRMSLPVALGWLLLGLLLMIVSSRILVWGSVQIARQLGVSDLMIGLTVVAVGTSLPELASSIIAVRKKEHDLVLGNVIGSNLFNTLAVVGIAGTIHPFSFDGTVLSRDVPTMGMLTALLLVFCRGFRGADRISQIEGGGLLSCYIGYTALLIRSLL